jgi:predicted dehydrogenase
VIGAGSLGYHHVRILRDMPEFRFVGFVDNRAERAAQVSQELGVKAYDTLDALLDDVDAVTIVVPTSAHFEIASRALERGKHVMIEKPITTTLDEADALLELAKKKGVLIQTGHVERFNRAVRAALPYVHQPRFIESDRLAPFSLRGSDVAVVLDLMIHDIDLVLTLVGAEAADIAAVGVPVLTPMVDIANARLTFASGAVANITASRISRERFRKIRIFQASGYLSLDLSAGTGEFFRLKEIPDLSKFEATGVAPELTNFVERIPLEAPEGEPLRLEFESFAAAIRGDAPLVVSGEDGRRALQVALRIVADIERNIPSLRA